MALNGKDLATFAKSKKGTPYVYGAKGADGALTQTRVNRLAASYPKVFTSSYLNKIKNKKLIGKICCDCSGLISWYTKKVLGSAQLYSNAYARLPISKWKDFAIGTVVWKEGHVGVYIGDGLVAEEKGIDYGCIISKITDTKWAYGLTFSWMTYNIANPVPSNEITYKGKNPYKEPTVSVKSGSKGEDVKWVQWELVEAGYNINIDGVVGSTTIKAIKSFQTSCKITADGICGATTIKYLKNDNVAAANKVSSSSSTTTKTTTTTTKAKNPHTKPKTTLKLNSKGVTVKWIQWELVEAGYKVSIDGQFGKNTETAVKDYQKKNGLTVDGVVGKATREHMDSH